MSTTEERSLAKTICRMLGACVEWKNTNYMSEVLVDFLLEDRLVIKITGWSVLAGPLSPINNLVFTIVRDPTFWTETSGLGDLADNIKAELDTQLQTWVVKGVME